MVEDNINIFSSTKIVTQAHNNTVLWINCISGTKKIKKELKLYIERSKWLKLRHIWLSYNYCCLAMIMAEKAGIPRYIDVLMVFIKQMWAKAKKIKNTGDE